MAITESLPVGNEVATASVGKTALVDGTVFAATFAAAGNAAGGAAAGKGAGAVAPVKGQQDLAAWIDGSGVESQGVDGAAAGAETAGGAAVSSLIGKREIVETSTGKAPGDEDLQDAVVGAGMGQAIRASGGKATSEGGAAGGDAAGKDAATGEGSIGSLRSAGTFPAGTAATVTGSNAIGLSGGANVRAAGVDLAGTDESKSLALGGVSGSATGVGQGSSGGSRSNAVGGTEAFETPEVKPAVSEPEPTLSASGSAGKSESGGFAALGAGDAEFAGVGVERAAVQPTDVAGAGAQRGIGKAPVAGASSKPVVPASGGTAATVATLGREKSGARGPAAAADGFGQTVAAEAGVAAGAAAGGTQSDGLVLGNALAAAVGVAPGAPAPDGPALPVASLGGATSSVGAGVAASSSTNGRTPADVTSPLSSLSRGTAHAAPGSGVTAGTGVTGSKRSSAVGKAASGETVAATLPVVTDGSNAPVVTVGVAVPTPLAAVPAPNQAPVNGTAGVSAAGEQGATVQGRGAVLAGVGSGTTQGKDSVGSARRSDGAASPRAGAHTSAGELASGATASGAVQGVSAEKSPTEPEKPQEGGQVAGGVVSVNGAGASSAHGSAAVGWNGVVTAPAVTVHSPAAAVAASGAATSTVATETVTGSGAATGLSSGLSTGLAGSGQGHTTLQATPTVLEVGVPGGSHGWLKIRAELGEGGSVQASVSSATQAGQDALRKELPAMSAYLQSEHVPVSLQMAHGTATIAAGGISAGDGAAMGFGSGAGGQTGANAEQSRSEGLTGFSGGSPEAGEQGSGRQPSAESDLGGAVTAGGGADGVSAVSSAAAEWASPLGYGGVSTGSGGNWVNVIA